MRHIPFYRHDLGELEMTKVREVLAQPILTTGDYVVEVEEKLEKMFSIEHALCVTSCTGGLHLALLGLDIGPGDEVITTPMSFIATATAIIEAGATPIFVDVEFETGNIDPDAVEAAITSRTRAIMPVHLYGFMCDMRRLREIADRHGLAIIEDAAHCVEGERDGVRPGALSNCAIFSFYATKNLTCGEGGAIVTRDSALKDRLTLLRLHGMTKTAADRAREGYTHWDMVLMGWKYNMSNIEAAFLLPQFDRLEKKWRKRRELASLYRERLSNTSGIKLPADSAPSDRHGLHLFTIWLDGPDRDQIITVMQEKRVEVVVNYRSIHLMQYFKDNYGYKRGAYPIAEKIGDTTLSLPFYPDMEPEMVNLVVERLEDAISQVS